MSKIFLLIVIAVVFFELLEHLVLPLIFYNRVRKKKPLVGRRSLHGKTARVVSWRERDGTVLLQGEYWKARSEATLIDGQMVRVKALDNLVLIVEEKR